MGTKRYDEWERNSEVYTAAQVESIAHYCGIEVVGETGTHFQCLCPFHANTFDPAFVIDKEKGLYHCFNPACGATGTLENLLTRLKNENPYQARRTIMKYGTESHADLSDRLAAILEDAPEFVPFPTEPVERMSQDLWTHQQALDYMHGRGLDDETLKHFEVGYSAKKNMIIMPMHDPTGMLVGFVGRSIQDKIFKNSNNLPKAQTMWNLHRARKHGDTVIVCESCIDAMRIHQAGYPNVVALLGGHLSPFHKEQLNKYFTRIIIATDFDERENPKPNCTKCRWRPAGLDGVRCIGHRPGRELGHSIEDGLPNKRISWAAYDEQSVWAHDAKDAASTSDDEIRQALRNAKTKFEYSQWGVEDRDLVAS